MEIIQPKNNNILTQYLSENPQYDTNYQVDTRNESIINRANVTLSNLTERLTKEGIVFEGELESYKDKGRHGEEGLHFTGFLKAETHESAIANKDLIELYLSNSLVFRNIGVLIQDEDNFGLITARVKF